MTRAPRTAFLKLAALWLVIALMSPGLRLVNLALSPPVVEAGSDLPDLENVFADAPRYYA